MIKIDDVFIGKKVIVRAAFAGVHYGILQKKDGDQVILEGSRRLWKWWAQEGISLSGVALHGVKHDRSSICEVLPHHHVMGVIEVIPVTAKAEASLDSAPVAKQAQ